MHAMTEDELRDSFVNAAPDELRLVEPPHDFVLTDWDHLDFLAWRDPRTRGRGYLVAERDGRPTGIVLRAADGSSSARAALCNLCHTMQPADQVALFTARKAGPAGAHGDSVGTYMCADLSCHENVRLAAPLAPNEVRASVDSRIDGTRRRTEAFIDSVCGVHA
ncbi:MAG: FBP domain-containing protein [Microbacterium sp.]|uniref:FBP domain-containing protein n=1 Tax=Microbacterium sp. TaxID=51671 RepID=UPI001AD2823C|nr:FBP domain-containing protein [Microbacterium sp.]MBN9153552.1 FBP domain-containing protein [Microbacterium sp.]MBN9173314.1 FBP domain-containing protein [Microbacterium sp.]MBN9185072.1 FBP domain-containing protein [Microbacterium sp.]MBN9187343.1 FBP domain-containing protein [Microbacterium sp.]MBN9193359.1 FBP domain-containing protein [Microbacterium sp.]